MKMKFLVTTILALSLAIAFNSCSKDDEENNSIVGTWKYRSVAAGEVKTNSTANDEKIKADLVSRWGIEYSGFIYVFREDGTVKLTDTQENDDISNGTYTLKDGILTLT